MTEQELRQKYTPLIALYTKKVLNEEMTIEQVPALLRDVVAMDMQDQESLAIMYAAKVMSNPLYMNDVPIVLRPRVAELVAEANTPTNINLYVAKILDGSTTIEEVPESVREYVIAEVESAIGKKVDWEG